MPGVGAARRRHGQVKRKPLPHGRGSETAAALKRLGRRGVADTDSLTVAALKRGSVTRLSHAARSSGSVRLLSYTFEGRIAGMQDVSEPRP